LPYFDFPVEEARADALHLNPKLKVLEFSSTTGEGFDSWLNYLRELVADFRQKHG
jgi:hydrogenase nickel incorporation protein HypB